MSLGQCLVQFDHRLRGCLHMIDGMSHRRCALILSISPIKSLMAVMCGAELLIATLSGGQTLAKATTGLMSGPKTDLFVIGGSDFNRPGLLPRANLSIGIGHTFDIVKKDPFGDEVIASYTYENAGTHGFIHTSFGEHTEALGIMKNFEVPRVPHLAGYTWLQSGITSYTGTTNVQNRLASSAILGAMVRLSPHNSIWIQESYNKVVTVPWYTTSSVGYVYSF